jgi:hypothetical protein
LKKWLPGIRTDHECEEYVLKTADGLFLTLLTALPTTPANASEVAAHLHTN